MRVAVRKIPLQEVRLAQTPSDNVSQVHECALLRILGVSEKRGFAAGVGLLTTTATSTSDQLDGPETVFNREEDDAWSRKLTRHTLGWRTVRALSSSGAASFIEV